jgi:hypothetical protein
MDSDLTILHSRHCATRQPSESATDAPTRTGSAAFGLLFGPVVDLRAEPEFDSAAAQLHHGSRHVSVATLVQADAIAVRQAEHCGDTVGVDEVFGRDERGHGQKATCVDGSVRADC